MVSPYVAKQMRLMITSPIGNYTVGVVEMIDFQPLRESSVEHRYGLRGTQPDNRHKVGMKRARFTIRRWFKTDPNQGKVFYDLHDNDTEFILKEYVKDSSGFVGLILNSCMSYDYRLITGTANDIVGEEISGEATAFDMMEEIDMAEEITTEIASLAEGTFSAPWMHPIAITTDGTIHVVYDDGSDTCYINSYNGGKTWSSPLVISVHNGHASIDFDSNGNLYVIITDQPSYIHSDLYLVKGTVTKVGQWIWNWGIESVIETEDCIYATILIDGVDTIHVACTISSDVGYRYMYSTDGGSSWTKYAYTVGDNVYTNLLEDSNHNIYLIFTYFSGLMSYRKVTYSGGSYTVGTNYAITNVGYYTTAIIDKTTGTIYLMYNKPRGYIPVSLVTFYFRKSLSLDVEPITWSNEETLVTTNQIYSDQLLLNNSSKLKALFIPTFMFEEWNSIGTWTYVGAGVSEISPSGQLHNKPNASTFILRNKTFSTGFSTTYTIEIKLKIDSFGTGDGYVSHEFYDGVHRIAVDIHADRIVNPDSATTIYTATNNDWHIWRFLVDSGNHILNVYKDGVLLGDLGGGFNYGLYAGTIYANCASNPIGKDGCESHEDYIGVTANLYAPPINAFGIYEIESTDNGETWSSPTHVTEGFKHPRGPIKEMSIFRIVFEKNGYLYYYQFGT